MVTSYRANPTRNKYWASVALKRSINNFPMGHSGWLLTIYRQEKEMPSCPYSVPMIISTSSHSHSFSNVVLSLVSTRELCEEANDAFRLSPFPSNKSFGFNGTVKEKSRFGTYGCKNYCYCKWFCANGIKFIAPEYYKSNEKKGSNKSYSEDVDKTMI